MNVLYFFAGLLLALIVLVKLGIKTSEVKISKVKLLKKLNKKETEDFLISNFLMSSLPELMSGKIEEIYKISLTIVLPDGSPGEVIKYYREKDIPEIGKGTTLTVETFNVFKKSYLLA